MPDARPAVRASRRPEYRPEHVPHQAAHRAALMSYGATQHRQFGRTQSDGQRMAAGVRIGHGRFIVRTRCARATPLRGVPEPSEHT
jgi:hypothetical protein